MYKIYLDSTLIVSSKIEELAIINPVIKLEANKAGKFTFTLPPHHPFYSNIQRKQGLIKVYRDEETTPIFEGICVSEKTDFYNQKTVTCEGDLSFLNDSYLRPAHRTEKTSRQLLEAYIAEHNSLTDNYKHFTVGMVTAKATVDSMESFTNYKSTMGQIKTDLVDVIGGYVRVRHSNNTRYIDYLNDSPRTSNQLIRLGENLLDLSQSLDANDIATVIIPLGAKLKDQDIEGMDKRLTISSAPADTMHPSGADYVYSGEAASTYGFIEKVVVFDKVEDVNELLALGKEYLTKTQFENLVIEAQAIDLGLTNTEFQNFRILDKIRVVSTPHGLDRYFILSKMTINLNNPEKDTITLGIEEAKSLTAKTQSSAQRLTTDLDEQSTYLKSAIDNATALITGAEGGHVVFGFNQQGQPTEIKIQDALNNPTKLWRWNMNGLGYSSNSGQTYGTAITMDGSIVANYITSGTMTADRIRGGELLLGGSGLAATGQITIRNSNNDVIGYWNKDGINVLAGSISGAAISGGTITGATITGGTITSESDDYTTTITSGRITMTTRSQDDPAFRIETRGGNMFTKITPYAIWFGNNAYIGAGGLSVHGLSVTPSGTSVSSLSVGGSTLTSSDITKLNGLNPTYYWAPSVTEDNVVSVVSGLISALHSSGILR